MEFESVWKAVPGADDTDNIERMKVPGGWLYRSRVSAGGVVAVALCFVPDIRTPATKKKTAKR